MRIVVDIEETQAKALETLSRVRTKTTAHLICAAVDEYIANHPLSPIEAAFGVWDENGEDGLAYQERLRAEWPR